MHNLQRLFPRRNKSSGARMEPTRRGEMPRRRLERRNATNHIDYDAASSGSSGEDPSVSPSTSSLVTRSLELPARSFRIEGVEGEMERIYRRLGLSGPEDLAIDPAAWEASKTRCFSDVLPRMKSLRLDSMKNQQEEASEVDSSCAGVAGSSADREDNQSTQLNESGDCSASGGGEFRDKVTNGIGLTKTWSPEPGGFSIPAVGGGIKGLRPPELKPPPKIRLPEINHACSTWDFVRGFAPEFGGSSPEANKGPVSSSSSSSSSSDNRYDKEEEEEVGAEIRIGGMHSPREVNELQLGDTGDDSCSFTTHDDSSSTTSNTSPNFTAERPVVSWQKGELLGRGSFGSVYEGISQDGDFLAVKEVSLLDQGSQAQECIQQLEREIALLSKLNHPNIVRYRGMDKDGSNLYIFLELVTQGSLLSLYKKYQLQDSQVSGYTRQILDGLKYLHDQGFVHRDIKCANILVDANGLVKLADFGLAKVTRLNDIKSCKGTPFWMAPEVINRKTADGYGRPADIWSLGCTVLEMLTRQIPYSNLEAVQALYQIGKGTLPSVPDTLSPDARDFIFRCLKVNPDRRPTAAMLLNHSFVRQPLSSSSGPASPYLHR